MTRDGKRLYYDCAISAAYMAKNFGVKFVNTNGVEIIFDKHGLARCNTIQRLLAHGKEAKLLPDWDIPAYSIKEPLDALYIHIDSLPIFEPQERDLISVYGATGYAEIRGGQMGVYEDDTEYPEFYPWIENSIQGCEQIIQRNNKPFLMPLTEQTT